MKTKRNGANKGQVLVIISLMLIGLVAILALVLDGGMLFSNRRAAQLAADAGALAGARAYCLADTKSPSQAVNAAITAATQYVDLNDADLVNVTVEAGGDVVVDTSLTHDTFFLGILGRPQLTATASATAGCAPPTKGIGVMPVAYSCQPPAGEEAGDYCDLHTMDEGNLLDDGICTPGEDPMYIVVDSEEVEGDIVCLDPPNSEPPAEAPEDIDYIDCDLNDDGVDDIDTISGGNKSWLDLTGGGGGAAELSDWIENGLDQEVKIHTWFQGQSGVATSVYKSIHNYQLNNEVIIPVFDMFCPLDPSDPENGCEYHPEDSIIGGDIPGFTYYHIITFALFRITCVDGGGGTVGPEGCPIHNQLEETIDLGPQAKTVEGCFVDGFDPGLGGGAGTVEAGAVIVYLKH